MESAKRDRAAAPKRPQSAYMLFAASARAELKKEQPDLKQTDVMKAIGVKWKALGEEAKEPYVTAAAAAKAEYGVAKAEWDALPEDEKEAAAPSKKKQRLDKEAAKKKQKDPNRPKRAQSAYMYFAAVKRTVLKTSQPDLKQTDVMKEIGKLWATASEQDKTTYGALAVEDKARYIREMETYVPPFVNTEEKYPSPKKAASPKKAKAKAKKATPQSKLAAAAKGSKSLMSFFGAPKPKSKPVAVPAAVTAPPPAPEATAKAPAAEEAMEVEEVAAPAAAKVAAPAVAAPAAAAAAASASSSSSSVAAAAAAEEDNSDLIGLKCYVTFEQKGRARQFSGKITGANAKQQVHIEYDDGEDEWATLPDKHVEVVGGRKRKAASSPKAAPTVAAAAFFSGSSVSSAARKPAAAGKKKKKRRTVVDSDDDEDEWDATAAAAPAAAEKEGATTSVSGMFARQEPSSSSSGASSSSSSGASAAAASASASAAAAAASDASGADVGGWAKGADVPYAAVVATFTEISKHTGRLKIVEHLCKFYRAVIERTPSQLVDCVYLTTNKIAPQFDGVELGLGETVLIKAIAGVTGNTPAKIKEAYVKEGDLGTIAEAKRSTQGMLFKPKILTAKAVLAAYRKIAATSGTKSQGKKEDQIKELLVAAVGAEAMYIVRGLQGKLRIRLAQTTCLVALAQAFGHVQPQNADGSIADADASWPLRGAKLKQRLEKAVVTLKQVFSEVPDFGTVVPALLASGINHLPEKCFLRPGVPVNPMLAKPTKGVGEVLDRFTDIEFTCELKYDGERAQIHLLPDGTVRVFSRNLENNTQKYPDIVSMIPTAVKPGVQSFIIDCEAVAYDRVKGTLLPFQTLSTRKKVSVQEEDVQVAVVVQAFDMLYLNGESLLKSTLEERRAKLHASFEITKGKFEYAKHWEGTTNDELAGFLEESIKAGGEGLMVKTLSVNATYEPSKRSLNWLKLKKDYIDGMGDSLDLVPIAAYWGKGKRTGVYGAFLVACYNADEECFETTCKIGTGFSDENLKLFASSLTAIPQAKRSFRISTQFTQRFPPDVWFEPNTVWEVKAADLSISPVHTAATGLVDPSKGVALRFPRFLRVRPDKSVEEATSSAQVAQFYNDQALT